MALTNHERVGKAMDLLEQGPGSFITVCEGPKRAQEPLRDNALVQSWPEMARLARESGSRRAEQRTPFGGGEA